MMRKKIPNSVRFEVFKRDKFTCQYCGRKAPDVVLECDHIQPASKGGRDDILNLVTSCVECNSGKSDRVLSESAMLEKSRRQLEELEERRQQLAMMVQWRESLTEIDETLIDSAERQIKAESGYALSDLGRADLRKHIKLFGYTEVCEAIPIAMGRYLRTEGGKMTSESFNLAFGKIGGICRSRKAERENPTQAQLFHALNIWKKAAGYPSAYTSRRALDAIKQAHAAGMDIELIKRICYNNPGITRLEDALRADA